MESLIACSTLKPCRHCGREVKIREIRKNSMFVGWTPHMKPVYCIRCVCGIQTKEYQSKSGVIKCWNRVPKEG